jgi:hypothetical protein
MCRVPIVKPPGGQEGFWSMPLDAIALAGGSLPAPEVVLCGSTATTNTDTSMFGGRGGAGGPTCIGALDSGTSLLTGTVRHAGALNRRLGFSPGAPPLPGGGAACEAEIERLAGLISAAGQADPRSKQLAGICQGLGAGPLSPQATLCALVLANIDAARAALQGGRGAPSRQTMEAAKNASVVDCQLLPYSFNATVDCNKIGGLPNVSFVIMGRAYDVTPMQYAARVSHRTSRTTCTCLHVSTRLGPANDMFCHSSWLNLAAGAWLVHLISLVRLTSSIITHFLLSDCPSLLYVARLHAGTWRAVLQPYQQPRQPACWFLDPWCAGGRGGA